MRLAVFGTFLGMSLSAASPFSTAAAAQASGGQQAKPTGKAINKAIYYDCIVRAPGETSQSEALALVFIGFRDNPDPQLNFRAASNFLSLPKVSMENGVLSQRVISDQRAYFWIGHRKPARPPVIDVAIEIMPSKEKSETVLASIRKFSDTDKGYASVVTYEGSCTMTSGEPAYERFSREAQ